jgi:hypothetical protein
VNVILRLWDDEAGFIISTELMIVAVALVLGLLVGVVSIRNQMVQELADSASAISEFNQSFRFSAITGHNASTAGSDFFDLVDICDGLNEQVVGALPAGVDVTVIDTEEIRP